MIVILGGGISGLSVAHELKKAGKNFILLEREKKSRRKNIKPSKTRIHFRARPQHSAH